MKKLCILFFLIMVLFYVNSTNSHFSLSNYFLGEYTCYSNIKQDDSTNLGFCYLNNTKNNSTIGESIKCNNLELSTAIKSLQAKIIKKEMLDNGTIVLYAHSPLIDKTINLNNKKINLQIAIKENETIIGWPLILGSF